MSEHDTDLDFDFFDDEPPARPPRGRRQSRPPGLRRPKAGAAEDGRRVARRARAARSGMTPLLRLAGLIAFAILIVVLFVFWISSCQDAGKKSSYKSYMRRSANVAKDSEQIGRELNDALTTQGIKFGRARMEARPASRSASSRTSPRARRSIRPGRCGAQHQAGGRGARVPRQRPARARRRFPPGVASPKNVTGNALKLLRRRPRVSSRATWSGTTCSRLPRRATAACSSARAITGVAVPGSQFRPQPGLRELALLGGDPAAAPGRGHHAAAATGGLHGTGLVADG